MECKNAYQQLLDAKQGRGGGAGGSSAGAAGGWGSAWGGSQGYGSSRTSGAGRGGAPPPPEETYSFGKPAVLHLGLAVVGRISIGGLALRHACGTLVCSKACGQVCR